MVTAQHEKNILIFPIQTQKISHINNRGTQKELSSSPKQGIDSYEQPKIGDISNKGVILCS